MSPKKTKATKNATPKSAKKQKVVKPAPVEESSDDSSDDSSEEETVAVPVTAKSKKQKAAKPVAKKEESSDDDSSDDDSEEEPAQVTAKSKKPKAAKPVAKKEESSDDASSDDGDSSDDSEDEAKPAAKAPKATKAPAKAEESSDDSDSDDEEEGKMEVDDDEDSSSDEDEAPAKANGKTNGVHKEEESDDDDSEDDDDDDSEEEEEAPVEVGKKRKGKQEKEVSSPKKAKVEEKATLYIGNLPEDFVEEKLTKFFKKKGVMLEEVRKLGKKPFAYADLEDASQLDVALELNGCEFKGNELKIEKATPKGQKQEKTPNKGNDFQQKARGGDRDSNTLFVRNLPFSVTEDQMREVFESATSIRLPVRPDGNPKGFGFIEFSSEAEADSAMKDFQGTEIEGRSIFLDFMGSKSKNMPSDGKKSSSFGSSGDTNVLFVKNLSYDSTPESLKEAFEGSTTARIATFQDSGKSRGFGFIEFATPEEAKKAHAAMQGANVDGRDLLVDFGGNKREGGGGGGFRGGRGGGGFRGGRGGGGRGGGGFRGGRGGGGFRGGRGGGRGGAHIAKNKGSIQEFRGTKKSFD